MYYIYVIRNGKKGSVKIGMTRDVEARRDTLQIGNPKELMIIAKYPVKSQKEAYGIESKLHHLFRRHHVRGEWFNSQLDLRRIHGFFNAKQGMNYLDRLELSKIEETV